MQAFAKKELGSTLRRKRKKKRKKMATTSDGKSTEDEMDCTEATWKNQVVWQQELRVGPSQNPEEAAKARLVQVIAELRESREKHWPNTPRMSDSEGPGTEEIRADLDGQIEDAEVNLKRWNVLMANQEKENQTIEKSQGWQASVVQLLMEQMDKEDAESWAKRAARRAVAQWGSRILSGGSSCPSGTHPSSSSCGSGPHPTPGSSSGQRGERTRPKN
jgi:hypothetical protein